MHPSTDYGQPDSRRSLPELCGKLFCGRFLRGIFSCRRFSVHDLRLTFSLLAYLGMLLALPPAYAREDAPDLAKLTVVVPEKIAGVTTVTAEQAIALLISEPPVLLIDARIRQDREYGYIENSISLPDIETNCQSLAEITRDKDQPLLFYCNGIQCGRSVVSIKIARSCGYHNLSWFRGGFAEWRQKGYQYTRQHH